MSFMEKVAVFDIEADKWIKLVVLGFFDGVEYRTFTDAKSFVAHLNQKRYDGWKVYAHAGGKYDFLFLLEHLFNLTSDVRIIDRSGRLISVRVRAPRATFTLVDSYALLPASLKNLTAAFQVEHEKGEYDFTKGVRMSKRLLRYLESDVLGLYEVLKRFSELSYIQGEIKNTIGSQSLHVFKTQFCNADLESISLEHEDIFREHYYSGGRVEVYKGHGSRIRTYDVNSLYPYVMLNDMPTGEMHETRTYREGRIGFYCVEVLSTPDFYIPPYLLKLPKKNYFVNGSGQYFMSTATIEHLRREYGVRFRVVNGFYFKGQGNIFRPFVEHFYKIKSESKDPTLVLMAKFFLNTLYGKLGQSRGTETIVGYKKGQRYRISDSLSIFGLVLTETYSRSRYILPYLAAYITELARLEQWKYIQVAPEEVFYGDTDSIYTTSAKLEKYVSPRIGMLKNEGTWEGIFLLPKTYALRRPKGRTRWEEKIKFKGFDAKSFRFRHFERALAGKLVLTEERDRLLTFRECFTRVAGIDATQGFFLNTVTTAKKTKVEAYDKRKVLPSRRFAFDTEAHDIKALAP